jgi:polygalacturonase
MDRLESRQLFSIPLPTIPPAVFLITASPYNASTASANNATAIQAAITAASNAGGGTVEVPAGTFMSGPITLSSKINLQIDAGAMLKALSMANYPSNTNPSNFITINGKNNVEISGSGTIDGNGADWWAAYNANNSVKRPRLINGALSNNVSNDTIWIHNVTLQNSPMFNIALSGSNNVTIDSVTITNPSDSPNTDGIDMGGNDWLIENSTIDTGDDNIVAKPGSTICSDMTVTNCLFKAGHGMSIGGQTNLGLDGLTVTNCTFDGTTAGIRMKADRGDGGVVTNCTYSNLTMYNVQYPINIHSYYPNTIPAASPMDPAQTYVAGQTPLWQNITISNVTSTWDSSRASYDSTIQAKSYTGIIWGLPEAPVANLAMSNVNISGAVHGIDINHVRNLSFDSQCSFTPTSGSDFISTSSASPPYDAQLVKAGWTGTDIGTLATLSTTLYEPTNDNWTFIVAGSGFTGTSDQFNLGSQDIPGNALISTKIASLTTANSGAKAGVMFRDGTAVGAAFVAVVEQTNKQVLMLYRTTPGGAVQSSALAGDTTSAKYVKLTRVGNVFTPFYSTNGTSWTSLASPVTIAMLTVKGGVCESSANTSTATTATFVGATVINDSTAPAVTDKKYLFSTSLNQLSFTFSEDVSASVSKNSLSVVSSPGGTPITVQSMTYTAGTNVATFTLATPLADSNYTATLNGATTTDPVGNSLSGGNATLPFFVLPGDVNRDGTVNLLDLNAIATNFGATGPSATFANGNVDFQNGINIADFNVLAAQFGVQIANPASSQTLALAAPTSSQPANLFSSTPIQPSVNLADETPDPLALAGIIL